MTLPLNIRGYEGALKGPRSNEKIHFIFKIASKRTYLHSPPRTYRLFEDTLHYTLLSRTLILISIKSPIAFNQI